MQEQDPIEREAIAGRKQEHVDGTIQDRDITVRTNLMSRQAAKKPSNTGHGQISKFSVDGMDQAKFKMPRNLPGSADLSDCWRPALHVVGAIAQGHVEAYFIMDPDLKKDSNMNCTVVSRMLDLVHEGSFKNKDVVMPRSLAIGFDNTCREGKNSIFSTLLAFLRATKVFEDTASQNLQPGHSHNEQDQLFSKTATLISRASVLEDPYEVADYMRKHLTPLKGHRLHVEVLDNTWDFQTWFWELGHQVKGLAATAGDKETCHSWQFVSASSVDEICGANTTVEVTHSGWDKDDLQPDDVVLIAKKYVHSTSAAQQPLLFLPHAVANRLSVDTLRWNTPNVFSDRTCKEFLKTAKAVGSHPWYLSRAQNYLESLIANNKKGARGKPVELDFVFNYRIASSLLLGVFVSMVVFQEGRG